MKGKVKFFNDQKGYGFIKVQGQKDIFVHHSSIIMDGRRTLNEDDEVDFNVEEGQKGQQAVDVRKV